MATFNHANLLTELIRRTQDDSDGTFDNNFDQEIDYKNRLIEIYGYPYDADIGPGGTYPSNYDGPDIYHYQYVDQTDLTGAPGAEAQVFTVAFNPLPAGIGHFDFDPHDNLHCVSAVDDRRLFARSRAHDDYWTFRSPTPCRTGRRRPLAPHVADRSSW